MRLRHLALIGVVLISAAISYAAFAPGPTAAVPPDLNSINVAADAAGNSAWTSYEITVRNLGDHDFFGSVLLFADLPSSPVSRSFRLPNVRSLQTLPALLPGLLPRSQIDQPDGAYELRVGLLPRHRHVFTVRGPGPPLFTLVEVLDSGGNVIAGPEKVSLLRSSVGVGVLSDDATLAGELERTRIGELGLRATVWEAGQGFPSSLLGLSGYAAIVLDRFEISGLNGAQLGALRDYVQLGGALVIGGGDLARTLRGMPAEMLPAGASAARVESLQPLAGLYRTSTDAEEAVASGQLAASARVLLAAGDDLPLLVERDYGAGRVVEMLFDARTLASRYQSLEDMAWSTAVGAVLQRTGHDLPDPGILLNAAGLPDSLLPQPSDAPIPPIWLVGVMLALYLVLAVPLNYWTTRRLGLPTLFWATAPALAVVFTAMAYVLGQSLQGGVHDQQTHLIKVAPNGAYSDFALHGVVFPERGGHVISGQAGDETAPLTAVFKGAGSDTCVNCSRAETAPAGGPAEHSLPLAGGEVKEDGVLYGSVRVVGTASHGSRPAGLTVKLSAGPGPGQLTGTIANTGSQPVGDLAIYTYYDGAFRWLPLVRELDPGGQVKVDGSFRALPSMSFASGLTPLLWEAGEDAVTGEGQVAVAGLVAPPHDALSVDGASIDSLAVGAFGMPVQLGASADPHGSFTTVSPVALAQQGGSWLTAYDLYTPPLLARPALDYSDVLYTQVEVYDWSSRTWKPAPSGTPLASSQVHSGLVLVRAVEPGLQPNWGSGLGVASLP